MKLILSSEVNIAELAKIHTDIFLRKPKDHSRVQNSLLLVPILNLISLIHTFTTYFFNINFKNIPPSMLWSSKLSIKIFRLKFVIRFSSLHFPRHEKYKIPFLCNLLEPILNTGTLKIICVYAVCHIRLMRKMFGRRPL